MNSFSGLAETGLNGLTPPEQELEAERLRSEKRRDEHRRIDHDRLERIERDIHDMRNLMFAAFQRKSDD